MASFDRYRNRDDSGMYHLMAGHFHPLSPAPERNVHRIWLKIGLWAGGWSIFLAGVGVAFVYKDINDARFRADLAVRGIHSIAIGTNRRCGTSGDPEFQIPSGSKRAAYGCAAEESMPRFTEKNPPGTRVEIVSLPGHPRLFVLAADGVVPQRDLTGIWDRWLWRTLALLALYVPITALILWRHHRRART